MFSPARLRPWFALLVIGLVFCASPAHSAVRLLRSNIDWSLNPASGNVRFHMRFDNPDPSPTQPTTGTLRPQLYGAFMPDLNPVRSFDIPSIAPNSFFDVFTEISPQQLPPSAPTAGGPPAGGPCPPPGSWGGNVDVFWQGGQVQKHMAQVLVCPGNVCSFVHVVTGCAAPMPWTVSGLCAGFNATLYEEDQVTPAPNPVPPSWHGWLCVTAVSGTPVPTTCCFAVSFSCGGTLGIVELCATTCDCGNPTGANPQPGTPDWTNVPGTGNVRFHVRWTNPSPTQSTAPASGDMKSQEYGVFLPDFGDIGAFNVPAIAPGSFFDTFLDIARTALPANPATPGGPPPSGPCPPDTSWNGNVDINWSTGASSGQVNYHHANIHVCPGSGNSYVHIKTLLCSAGSTLPWTINVPCSGFNATLVNEDYSPAPNPVPPGWTGYICVTAAAATPVPTTCCFTVTFTCNGVPGLIYLCATTCNCQTPANPVPGSIDWTTLPGGDVVRFHVRWDNPSADTSSPIEGDMMSQELGVFLPDFGSIGHFQVPAIAANSFFDVFLDAPLGQLPPSAPKSDPTQNGGPCPPIVHWDGNVDVHWYGAAGGGVVTKHIVDITVCPGSGASLIHIGMLTCPTGTPMPWSMSGLCPGFTATLVMPDSVTPAPNPVPPGWTGYVRITAAGSTPVPDTCCFQLTFLCDGVPGVIDLCAITCDCNPTGGPQPGTIDWNTLPDGHHVRFHIRWNNPGTQPTQPISGDMHSQPFGAFLPPAGLIGHFDVPAVQANGFFDVFLDVAKDSLPPQPPTQLPGGGPQASGPCPQDDHWDGNVDVTWGGPGGSGTVNKHVGTVLLNSGGGNSLIHVISGCTLAVGTTWSMSVPCPGFHAVLLNEDHSPAPAVLPAGWTGWIAFSAPGLPAGSTCCVDLTLQCGSETAVIEVCGVVCYWGTLGVEGGTPDLAFGIRSVVPNPSGGPASVSFTLSKPERAKVEVFDTSGQRVRTVADGPFGAGVHNATWDGRDARGNLARPGTYFVRLSAGTQTASHKLVLMP